MSPNEKIAVLIDRLLSRAPTPLSSWEKEFLTNISNGFRKADRDKYSRYSPSPKQKSAIWKILKTHKCDEL